jgi:type I restriction enzyme, S subunit
MEASWRSPPGFAGLRQMIGRIRYWRELDRWVPGGPASIDVAFPVVQIGDLLRIRREVVSRSEFAKCQPITIHFDGSIDPRDRHEPFKGTMFAAYPGDVVFSKIDLRNGAIGIVPEVFTKVVVTSEYPVFVPDLAQVDPRYLALVLRSPDFLHLLKSSASGTSGRKRIDVDGFGGLEIPLPDLTDQIALLDRYEASIESAHTLEQKARELEHEGVRAFESTLGLVPPPNLPHRLLQIVGYRDIGRWGHEALLQQALKERTLAHSQGSESEPVELGDYVEVTHGCSASPSRKATALEVLKISACTRGYFRPTEKKYAPDRLELRRKYDLKKGDILMCRVNGTLAYVGMSALVDQDVSDLIFPDKIIRVRIINDGLLPEFLWRLLQLPAIRRQIESASRTAVGNHAIGSEDINDLQVVIPSMPTQMELVKSLQRAQLKADDQHREASRVRAIAATEFLGAVFH